jgi:hypothetical protein
MKNNEEGRLIPVLPDPVIVKVVGLGGVGSILLPYLALYLRSTGNSVRLVLVDGDTFDPTTNTKRMFFNEGQDLTVAIEKYHPEIKNPKGKMPTEMDCVELAFSQPQILFTNMAVASTMLSMFYTFLCGELEHQEVKFDILEARMLPQLPLKEKIGMVLEKHETV